MFDKFAEELKAAREKKGLTIQQVAQKTKIDIKFLEIMEEGDLSFLPELYVIAFLKNYARVVGLDEEITVQKYYAAKAGKEYEDLPPAETEAELKKTKEAGKKKQPAPVKSAKDAAVRDSVKSTPVDKKKYIYGAIAGIVIIFVILYFIFTNQGNTVIITEKPINEIVEENRQRYLEEETEPVLEFRNDSDSLQLNIASSETSWVKIVYDDKSTGEFILFPMSQKLVKASDNFKITFGNSQGISLKLNGKDIPFGTGRKTVARVKIDSSGMSVLNSQ
jgi:transcriptional regulator with XRE-family HTH domain